MTTNTPVMVVLPRVILFYLYLGRRTLELSCDWRHWTVMKMVLDVFGKFNKIDLINSRFGSKHAVRFYPADRCLLVYLAVNHFEVLSKPEGCG